MSLFAFVGSLVDWLNKADRATFYEVHGTQLIIMGVIVVVILPVLKFLFEATSHQGLYGNFPMRIRWLAHRFVLRQSIEFFQDDFAGRIATKVMQTALAVRETVLKITEVLLYVSIYFTSAIVLFASSDFRLTGPLILWLAGYTGILIYFMPRMRNLAMEQAEARSMVTGRIVDAYTNISSVKMFAHADHEDNYAREGMDVFLDNVYKMMRLSTIFTTVLHFLNALLIASTAGLAIWLWSFDAVTTGAIAFAIGLVLRMQGMSQWIFWEISGLFENVGVVQDGIETISRDRSVTDKPGSTDINVLSGVVAYEKINFNYGKPEDEDGEESVIQNLSLKIKAGQKVGLVGRSGAGKSTLVNLLLRLYDLEGGKITLDGQDIAEHRQDSVRDQIGMVSQDTSLLHRSVAENIGYGHKGWTLDDVIAAAKLAEAHEFILGLEDGIGRKGYDAHVGERGVKLSGGQRQRIAIARVLLKDAPILVLDEATSALDSEVEAEIQKSLYRLMEGKTVIAIAHRLSTIAAMDELVVMDKGKIIERGTHKELLKKKGLYASLWERQSGGFLIAQDDQNKQGKEKIDG